MAKTFFQNLPVSRPGCTRSKIGVPGGIDFESRYFGPRCDSVALFFCVRLISSSMSLIFSRMPMTTR